MKINIQTKYLHIYIENNDYEFVLSALGKEIHLIIENKEMNDLAALFGDTYISQKVN